MATVTTLLNGYSLTSDQGNPAFCSVLLVESGADKLVFDFGHVGRRRALVTALAAHGLAPADVGTVVLSHGHWDHLQNADLFTAARVLVHADERRHLESAGDPGTPRWAAAVLDGLDVHETGEADPVLPGVQVIELPGHTPGSIGLVVETGDGRAVLTADAVPTLAVLRSGRPSGRPSDRDRATAAVHRVAALADVVHPGHDGVIRRGSTGFDHAGALVPLTFRVPVPTS